MNFTLVFQKKFPRTHFHIFSLALIFLVSIIASAQESATEPDTTVLEPENSGILGNVYVDNGQGFPPYGRLGIGLGADSVYRKTKGFSASGYFDSIYENFASTTNIYTPSNLDDQIGLVRGVGFFGYRINQRLVINSEIGWSRDLEDSRTGKVAVDLAYMDYFVKDNLALRAGILLVSYGAGE
jgi:hypothetical protein